MILAHLLEVNLADILELISEFYFIDLCDFSYGGRNKQVWIFQFCSLKFFFDYFGIHVNFLSNFLWDFILFCLE